MNAASHRETHPEHQYIGASGLQNIGAAGKSEPASYTNICKSKNKKMKAKHWQTTWRTERMLLPVHSKKKKVKHNGINKLANKVNMVLCHLKTSISISVAIGILDILFLRKPKQVNAFSSALALPGPQCACRRTSHSGLQQKYECLTGSKWINNQ